MENKGKYLIKNTILLFISNFSSKILVFLLVPLYTSVLTTEEYGNYDLLYTTVLLLTPILTINISDAVMRFLIDTKFEKQQQIFHIGTKYIGVSIIVFAIGVILLNKLIYVPIIDRFLLEFILLFASHVIYQLLIQFSKGVEDVKGLAISGTIGTLVLLLANILMLLVLKLGLKGYFYANIIGAFIPSAFLFFHSKAYKYYIWRQQNKSLETDMVKYASPLILNSISWNINNLSDRYVVTYLCGVAVNGIYSVAYKIPAILNAVQTIFIQAWQISAIKEYNRHDEDGFFKNTYQNCHCIMLIMCSAIVLFTKIFAKLLYAKEFYTAWKYVPVLCVCIVFNTLAGIVGGIFVAEKDSISLTKIAIWGASINIILNFVLISFMGAIGAAFATLVSSVTIWLLRIIKVKKYIDFNFVEKKQVIEYFVLFLQVILMTYYSGQLSYVFQLSIFLILVRVNFSCMKGINILKNK